MLQTGALAGFGEFRIIAKVNISVGVFSFPIAVAGAYLNRRCSLGNRYKFGDQHAFQQICP